MLIALMDETRKTRYVEVEDEPEPRFVLSNEGFDYIFERRADQPNGTPTYFLVDAEVTIRLEDVL